MDMLLSQLGLLLILLPVCSFAPGFYLVRKLRWRPLEKLCGSVGLSLLLLYLVSWAIYCLTPRGDAMPVHALPFVIVTLICGALAMASWKDIGRLAQARSVRGTVAGFGFLLVWTGLLMVIIRNYSGGGWAGDWLEHFQRSLFFLQHFPADTRIVGGYHLSARPPMMNLLAAFFMAQTADRFELFQTVFAFLNLLLFLPCCLIMPSLGKKAARRTWLLALLFATSPLVMQNATYSWTKAAAAFYVVLALCFYVAGWRRQDRGRTTAAFVALAAGLLAHYSAGPYVAILTLHYLAWVFPHRRQKWRELAGIAVPCGLLLGTWLVWSIAVYGMEVTFASNTTVTASREYAGGAAEKFAGNLLDTIVPVVARDPSLMRMFDQPNFAGKLRDWAFLFYQVNVIFGMGLVGGPMVLWLLYMLFQRKRRDPPPGIQRRTGKAAGQTRDPAGPVAQKRFWLILIVISVLLGVAVVGERDRFGSAHLTMLSLEALGLSMLAAVIPLRRRFFAILLLGGCLVDFSLGVLLQARVESLENTAKATLFSGLAIEGGAIRLAAFGPNALSQAAFSNWYYKHRLAFLLGMLQGLDDRHDNGPAYRGIRSQISALIAKARTDDAGMWQNWYQRHDGEMTFLGDHTAGENGAGANAATASLLLLFIGMAGWIAHKTQSHNRPEVRKSVSSLRTTPGTRGRR
jgi:hypothetical protein